MAGEPRRTRETRQRRVVFDTILGAELHPTAEWIFDHVRREIPNISLATVYRNLSVLKLDGRINEIVGADRKARYDARTVPHAHFICTACSDVWDVGDAPETETDWRTIKDLVGCEVHETVVEFRGLCAPCRRANNHRNERLRRPGPRAKPGDISPENSGPR